ncbi:MAG: hypothetical protein ACRDX8_15195, partial [Acidimicrobiales bacterium]
MISADHLGAVIALLLGALLWIVWSVRRHPTVDQGDGLGLVRIPPPHPVRLLRMLGFLLVLIVYAVFIVSIHAQLGALYAGVVLHIAVWVLPAPTEIAPYTNHMESGLRAMIAASIVAFALVLGGTMGRRLSISLHAGLYLGMAVLLDALVIVVSATTRFPIAYVGIEGIVLNMLLWATVMLRVFFTTFALPRPSAVPVARGVYRAVTTEAILIAVAVFALLAILIVGVVTLGTAG